MTHDKLWTREFLLLSISNFGLFTSFYLLIPTLPLFSVKELGLSKIQVGYILGAYTVAALIIRPFVGRALDTMGRKMVFLSSFLVFVLFFPMYIQVSGFVTLLVLRVVQGLSWGTVTTAGSTSVIDIIPPRRRGEGIGVFGLFITLAMALAPAIGIMISESYSFNALFWVATLLGICGFILLLLVKFPSFTPGPPRPLSLEVLFEKTSIPSSLNLMLIALPYGGLLSFVSLFANEARIGHSGAFFMVMAGGIALMRFFAGRIFDRKGPGFIMTLGMVSLSISFPALALSQTPPLFLAAGFLIGLGSGVVMPTFQAMINNLVVPQRRGVANSTLFTAFDLGIGAGMILTGWLSDTLGIRQVFFGFGLLSVVSLLVFLTWVVRNYRRAVQPV